MTTLRVWQQATRICTKCGIEKPMSEYYLSPGSPKKNPSREKKYPHAQCKPCVREYMVLVYRKDPEGRKKTKEASRRNVLRKTGATPALYAELFLKQGGKCLICQGPQQANRNLCVDHCHKTGKIRGLLCTKCNSAIGKLGDDPAMLLRALHYLDGKL
jgi:hypothetical protein